MLTHALDGKHKVKARNMMRSAGYRLKRASGGRAYTTAHADEKPDMKVEETPVTGHKSESKLKLKTGGMASHEKSHARLDKSPRAKLAKGGKAKPHTKINIMVAPGHSGGGAPGMGAMGAGAMPPMMPPPAAIGAPGMAPRPPMGPGTAPPMARPGMMPQMAKKGGKIVDGKIGHYTAGAASGVGREEKTENQKKYKKG